MKSEANMPLVARMLVVLGQGLRGEKWRPLAVSADLNPQSVHVEGLPLPGFGVSQMWPMDHHLETPSLM